VREKARQNLKAGRVLLDAGLLDAAASRFYYAAFQAAVYALERQGRRPSDFRGGARRWEHRMVAGVGNLARGRVGDDVLLDDLRRIREDADYKPGAVRRSDLEFLKHEAARFVEEVTR